jgi:hypothetical protein
MNDQRTVCADAEQSLAALAAKLTAAAYPVALRHGAGDKWLDLQLELWRALTETIKKWGGDCRQPDGAFMRVPPFQSSIRPEVRN